MVAPFAVCAPSAMSNYRTQNLTCFQLRSPLRTLPTAFRSGPAKSGGARRSPLRVAAVLNVTDETFNQEVLEVSLLLLPRIGIFLRLCCRHFQPSF